ncbi:MAG: hypothetical protein JNK37_21550 [Verrucomicrobiales bacterium]|nr:hypothetical protein [Verrucomicrobiales bacterium]
MIDDFGRHHPHPSSLLPKFCLISPFLRAQRPFKHGDTADSGDEADAADIARGFHENRKRRFQFSW